MKNTDLKTLDLSQFLKKVIENEMNKVKVTHLEVENYGLIEFVRPKEGVILNYLTNTIKCSKIKKTEDDIEIKEIDIKELLNVASEFVYICCPLLQSKEVREQFPNNEPYDIPGLIFTTDGTMDLAGKLNDIFNGKKIKEKTEETIKN